MAALLPFAMTWGWNNLIVGFATNALFWCGLESNSESRYEEVKRICLIIIAPRTLSLILYVSIFCHKVGKIFNCYWEWRSRLQITIRGHQSILLIHKTAQSPSGEEIVGELTRLTMYKRQILAMVEKELMAWRELVIIAIVIIYYYSRHKCWQGKQKWYSSTHQHGHKCVSLTFWFDHQLELVKCNLERMHFRIIEC